MMMMMMMLNEYTNECINTLQNQYQTNKSKIHTSKCVNNYNNKIIITKNYNNIQNKTKQNKTKKNIKIQIHIIIIIADNNNNNNDINIVTNILKYIAKQYIVYYSNNDGNKKIFPLTHYVY